MSTTQRLRFKPFLGILAVSVALGACGATQPTPELSEARNTYEEVASGEANRVVPAQVLTAKQALDRAEAAHKENPGSFEERSLAYVAQREAQLAAAHADIALAERDRQGAERLYAQTQEQLRSEARSDLGDAQEELQRVRQNLTEVRSELSEQGTELTERTRELTDKEQKLEQRMKELQAERTARMEAEQAAADAIASLERVAQVKEEARGTVITLSGAVLFPTGQSDLLPIAENRLGTVAEALKSQDDGTKIVIEGHTDSRGSEQMNMELSKARADSVRAYLVSKGVDGNRIEAVGKGENRPIATNDTPEGRANNRRVEIVLQKSSEKGGS